MHNRCTYHIIPFNIIQFENRPTLTTVLSIGIQPKLIWWIGLHADDLYYYHFNMLLIIIF